MLSLPNRPTKQRHRRHPRPASLNQQRGVVIVVALFIVALAAALAYVMIARLDRDMHRTGLMMHDVQAALYAEGATFIAINQLQKDWATQKPNQLVDVLPITFPAQTIHGYTVTSTLYDLQARFNLNNLSNAQNKEGFLQLLQTVSPTLSEQNRQDITNAIIDWITPSSQSVYDQYYLAQNPPYRAAHRALLSISQLPLIKGMTPALYQALEPYVIALPATTLVNVVTAPAAVLTTLGQTINLAAATQIVQARTKSPITSTSAFTNMDIIKNHPISADKITVTSNYFLLETNVRIEEQNIVLYTFLERQTKDTKATVTILWQSRGSL